MDDKHAKHSLRVHFGLRSRTNRGTIYTERTIPPKKENKEEVQETVLMRAVTAIITGLIFLSIFAGMGAGANKENINQVVIFSQKPGSIVRLYAKENATSFIYENITIKLISNSNNSTALIYFNSILQNAFNFSYETTKNYNITQTTQNITVILNNKTHEYNVRVLTNINLDKYINYRRTHLKYTEQEVQALIAQVKLSMLEKITVGFLIGFIIVAIYLVRRLKNEIQPVL